MEVHHHPDVERKGIREYLLEGLMIFLAVTIGFFAESLREHIYENSRAGEYAKTMSGDLRTDTSELKAMIAYYTYAANNFDTLMQLLTNADPAQISSGKLYWYGLFGASHRPFAPQDATLLEMKSSGSLRYFSDPGINRQVAQYDQLCQIVKSIESSEIGVYTEVRKSGALLFNFKYIDAANNIFQANKTDYDQAKIDSFINSNPVLLSTDRKLFNQYIFMVRSRYFRYKIGHAKDLLSHATALIAALKKEYSIDND
jgi:hypothetical protein